MNNRYASINERLAAQEIADREDGDAIRREAAREAEDLRLDEIYNDLTNSDKILYLEDFIESRILTAQWGMWIRDKMREDYGDD